MTIGQRSREISKEERRDCDETKALYSVFYRFFKNQEMIELTNVNAI